MIQGDDHLGGQRRSTNFNNIHNNGEKGENASQMNKNNGNEEINFNSIRENNINGSRKMNDNN